MCPCDEQFVSYVTDGNLLSVPANLACELILYGNAMLLEIFGILSEKRVKCTFFVIQCAIKFTNDPPAGLRSGLKRTFYNVSDDLMGYSTAAEWKPLLYAISFFHR